MEMRLGFRVTLVIVTEVGGVFLASSSKLERKLTMVVIQKTYPGVWGGDWGSGKFSQVAPFGMHLNPLKV
jgi:hypothetical protein